jgi:hypothetical protein
MDPTLFCISYRKNRFYLFSKREPADVEVEKTLIKRDIQNEKVQKEEAPLYAQPIEATSAKQVNYLNIYNIRQS